MLLAEAVVPGDFRDGGLFAARHAITCAGVGLRKLEGTIGKQGPLEDAVDVCSEAVERCGKDLWKIGVRENW